MFENLFITDDIISRALLKSKALCSEFLESSFGNTEQYNKLPLFMFIEHQVSTLIIEICNVEIELFIIVSFSFIK